jgi:hypothetical protein
LWRRKKVGGIFFGVSASVFSLRVSLAGDEGGNLRELHFAFVAHLNILVDCKLTVSEHCFLLASAFSVLNATRAGHVVFYDLRFRLLSNHIEN